MHDIAAPAQPEGYFSVDHPFGVLTNIPLVWLALAAPLAWRSRPVEARSILRWFLGAVALLFGMCALTLALHDSMCLRYELEYASPLVLLAVIGVLALERALAGQPVWRRAARCGWGLLLAFSVAFNLFAGFDLQATTSNVAWATLLQQKGRVDEAITQYQKALQLAPDYAAVRADLGNALLQKGKVDEAITQYQAALRIEPRLRWTPATTSASLFCKRAEWTKRSPNSKRPCEIKPDYAEAHNNLGNALLQKGRVDEAITQYQKALQIKPDYAEAHNNLGTALLQKGRVDEAIGQYQEALQIKPEICGRPQQPRQFCSKRAEWTKRSRNSERPCKSTRLGGPHQPGRCSCAYRRSGRSIAQFHKALEIKPDYADAHYSMGRALA